MRLNLRAATTIFATLFATVRGHGGHADGAGPMEGETMKQYAVRHMATEHHIDAFDLESFFALHDFNSDGLWTVDEIEAIYGVHHAFSRARSPDMEAHDAKAKLIVESVLKLMDKNGDGVVSLEEFEAVGLDGLPDHSALGAEGHHYDKESEFFLHHEEQFHSTPETQTDESYNHPEDREHFDHHEEIELEEENKERAYQGLEPVDKLPEDHDAHKAPETVKTPLEEAAEAAAIAAADPNHITPMDGQGHVVDDGFQPNPRYTRGPKPTAVEAVDVLKAAADARAKPGYGEGPDGYKPPKSKGEKLRRNLPYKYKFRRSWGDF